LAFCKLRFHLLGIYGLVLSGRYDRLIEITAEGSITESAHPTNAVICRHINTATSELKFNETDVRKCDFLIK